MIRELWLTTTLEKKIWSTSEKYREICRKAEITFLKPTSWTIPRAEIGFTQSTTLPFFILFIANLYLSLHHYMSDNL